MIGNVTFYTSFYWFIPPFLITQNIWKWIKIKNFCRTFPFRINLESSLLSAYFVLKEGPVKFTESFFFIWSKLKCSINFCFCSGDRCSTSKKTWSWSKTFPRSCFHKKNASIIFSKGSKLVAKLPSSCLRTLRTTY